MDRSKPGDRDLGMDRSITRRDFIAGSVAVGALACSPIGSDPQSSVSGGGDPARDPTLPPTPYPPALGGLRGSHTGSFEVAHQLALEGRTNWEPIHDSDAEVYDLVVVGSGVSGLAAAYFYREQNPNARILILENHDDFGGHARRNEFEHDGRTLLGHGGSQSLEEPGRYSAIVGKLLVDPGVETKRFYDAYDQNFASDHDLGSAIFFDRAHYGVDRLVAFDLEAYEAAPSREALASAVEQMPISQDARAELARLYSPHAESLPDLRDELKSDLGFLNRISYRDFLRDHLGVSNKEVLEILHGLVAPGAGVGPDGMTAMECISYTELPGLRPRSLNRVFHERYGGTYEPYIFHFPDGNASIARLLVRSLIPRVASGNTMEDVVGAKFHYDRLDERDSDVRLRLASTVVRVAHEGPPATSDRVAVTYLRGGRSERVWAKGCVLACYNRVVPYLCPELPAVQREALSTLVKAPIVYTNVLLRNWRPWKKAGLGFAVCPGSYHQTAMLDYPVSLGEYQFSSGPDEPIVAHLERAPVQPFSGLSPRDQYKAGRFELLQTSFEAIERSIRLEMGGMLGHAGFDPALDIEAITVNRWPHGYAYQSDAHVEEECAEHDKPYVVGRQRFGRVTIANSDAGGQAYLDTAIEQAHRAVLELST